jgi:putative ABC transport system permease protein
MTMNNLLQDLRFGWRRLLRHPGLNLVIVLTLALCIGASAALFSLIRHVLLEPFPYLAQDRLMIVYWTMPEVGHDVPVVSVPEYLDLAAQTQVFRHIMCGTARDLNLTGGDRPERVHGAAVTASVFPMLGMKPLLGRTFLPEEDRPGGPPVVVLAYDFWQRRFAADPRVVGRQISLAGQSYTVLGVMPRRFRWWDSDLWFPLGLDTAQSDRANRSLTVFAQLLPDLDRPRAEQRLASLDHRLSSELGRQFPEYRGIRVGLRSLLDEVLRNARPALFVLFGAVALVFLIACANVANLFMAQATERRQEMAVRIAMGAKRHRLVRQLLTESLVLALAGGACGFLLAWWAIDAIASLIPYGYIPAETEVVLDGWALVFTVAISVLAALLFGLTPALQTWRESQALSLKEGVRRATGSAASGRARGLLVVAEVTLALVVLVGAGLMIQSFRHLAAVDPGFDPHGVLTMRVAVDTEHYPERHQVGGFFRELLHRVEALPGVSAAGAIAFPPLTVTPSDRVTIEGRPSDTGVLPDADLSLITPGYFAAMRIPLHAGRLFSDRDDADAPVVAIANEAMARRFWGSQSPLGKRLKVGPADSPNPWMTIVGVVGDVRQSRLDAEPRQAVYFLHIQRQTPRREMTLTVRSRIPPENLAAQVRQTLRELDPQQPISLVQTMDKVVLDSLGARRLTLVLLIVFAGAALVLTAVGIFAVLANSVSQRTHEIGIRVAVGAQWRAVVMMFVIQGLRLTILGIVLGLLVALASSRVLSAFVYGVSTVDVPTFAGIALLFLTIAAAASYLPARRAAKIDPTVAMRYE